MQDPSSLEFPAMRPPAPFPEQEQLKCPRCDSANTKFCYYNNYNLSQPRYFCKDCRRYWTKGGTLRNIPVGGGTRKSAAAKRSSNPKRANPDPTPDSPRVARRVSEPPLSPPSSSSTPAVVADTFSASTPQQFRSTTADLGPGQNPTRVYGLGADQGRKFAGDGGIGVGGSFSSLLAANSQFGGIFDGLSTSGSDLKTGQVVGGLFGEDLNSGLSMGSGREMGLDLELQERGGGDGGGSGGEGYLQGGEWGNSNNGWPDLAIYTPGSNFH